MSVLLPLPAKPVGDPDSLDEPPQRPPQADRPEMAIQQYFGPLKFQKMAAWVQAMSVLTGTRDFVLHTAVQAAACANKKVIDSCTD
jgi:hypothetical protein